MLNTVQCFLDRGYKRKYTSQLVNIKDLLENQDRKIFKVASKQSSPLYDLLPKKKLTTYSLRKETNQRPTVNTERFKSSFVNRLIYNYNPLTLCKFLPSFLFLNINIFCVT